MINRALFVGRFQPFHNGHLAVVRKLLAKHDEVIVIIGSAEESISSKNPFTAGERMEMVRSCFNEHELGRLIIVPLRDINNNSLWVSHVSSHVPEFKTIYSNNWLVKHLFSKEGYEVAKLDFFDRANCEGKKIRAAIASGKNGWEKHVPKPVASYLRSIDGIGRIKEIEERTKL
jgi:nicotinamide-nucleotide adenylyltransferase